jgi:N-methylhydantoinase B
VLDAAGAVDAAASQKLRAAMAKKRGPVALFDRGFESIDELKGRCLAETGLEPPVAPQFTKVAVRAAGAPRRASGR